MGKKNGIGIIILADAIIPYIQYSLEFQGNVCMRLEDLSGTRAGCVWDVCEWTVNILIFCLDVVIELLVLEAISTSPIAIANTSVFLKRSSPADNCIYTSATNILHENSTVFWKISPNVTFCNSNICNQNKECQLPINSTILTICISYI